MSDHPSRRDPLQVLDAQALNLRRGLGSPALFGIVQGFVAASLYFSLGLVADRAGGWTWFVYAGAALFFVVGVLSYVEAASLHKERGGVTVFARYAFNELWSFVAGWAVLLDYLIITAICALVATSYLGGLWSPLDEGLLRFLLAAALVLAVAFINYLGATPKRFERTAVLILADLGLQLLVIVLGLALLFEPGVLSDPTNHGGAASAFPGVEDILFAFTLAAAAFSGLDASSGLAGDVQIGRRGLRRLVGARSLAGVLPYVCLSLVAASVLPLGGVSEREYEAPMLGIAAAFENDALRGVLEVVIPLSALGVLFAACNAGMLGLSRLGYSLATNRQIPSAVGRLSATRSTPWVLIVLGAIVAVSLLVPLDLEFLAGIYAFGAMLAFTLVHLSVIVSRFKEPDADRPFRVPLSIPVGRGSVPLPSALGVVMSLAAFGSVLALHGGARIAGLAWMGFGVGLYLLYRKVEGKSITKRVTVPEQALTGTREEVEYGSILVPVLGTDLDDDIMQTAGRLADDERSEKIDVDTPYGCSIEAVWVQVVPMSLPLDGRLPKADVERAEKALARAKAVGEEYGGVTVNTSMVRGRRLGEKIVEEAKRRQVEAIVLAAEPPSRVRGGALLGGREVPRDSFLGDATRYVVTKAPCRVIFTAPPADEARGTPGPVPSEVG